MIWPSLKEFFPIAGLPETEAFHVRIVITHRRIGVGRPFNIEVNQLFQIRANNLISIDEDYFLEVHGKEHVKEQDLVSPYDSLLFSLFAEPRRPFVCYELVLEPMSFGKVRYEFL